MTLEDAMRSRHMVRKYLDRPLSVKQIEQLNARIAENNRNYGVSIKLMVNDTSAFNAIIKLLLAKGVKNYLILSGPDTPELGKKLGYCGADLMLYAQTLGLNTWWVGGTFSRKTTAKAADGEKVIGVIAVGYGVTQGVPHKSKKPEEVSSYDGEPPEWFRSGVKAALLAPTALAKQAFSIKGHGTIVTLTCDNGIFTGADFGLVKYHFELGAGKEKFEWANSR